MRTAILGAGSLGTILGAYITKNGGDVLLVDVNEEHVDALNKNGATISGETSFNVPVKACTPDEMKGKFDLVLYLAKAPANEVALSQLKPHLHDNSTVCTLQNGIPEEAVASIVGRERTIGGTVGWGATWVGPGASKLTTSLETIKTGAFEIGELDGSITERIKDVKKVLELMGHTEITTNLMGTRWSKLFINATYSGMSAALGVPYGGILDDSVAFIYAMHVGNEVVKVAELLGIDIVDFQGKSIKAVKFNNEKEMAANAELYRGIFMPHRLVKASMLNDMERGIFKTEIDNINGAVVESGKKVDFPTPFNEKIVELVKRAQDKKEVPTFSENLKEFHKLAQEVAYKIEHLEQKSCY